MLAFRDRRLRAAREPLRGGSVAPNRISAKCERPGDCCCQSHRRYTYRLRCGSLVLVEPVRSAPPNCWIVDWLRCDHRPRRHRQPQLLASLSEKWPCDRARLRQRSQGLCPRAGANYSRGVPQSSADRRRLHTAQERDASRKSLGGVRISVFSRRKGHRTIAYDRFTARFFEGQFNAGESLPAPPPSAAPIGPPKAKMRSCRRASSSALTNPAE